MEDNPRSHECGREKDVAIFGGTLSTGDLHGEEHWRVNGCTPEKTSADWLRNMDAAKPELLPLLVET